MIAAMLGLLALTSGQAPDTTLTLPRGGRITVDGGFSNVTLEAGTGNRVQVRGGTAHLRGSHLEVEGDGLLDMQRDDARIHLVIPGWAAVEVSIFEGDLDASGPLESLRAEVVSGSVRVRGGTGQMLLDVMNGPVAVRGFRGSRLEIEALNDQVDIDDATGNIKVEVVNGDVMLRNIASRTVAVESVNGRLQWQGALGRDGNYAFSSHNGDIRLLLPPSTGANVTLSTVMGDVTGQLLSTPPGQPRRPGRRSIRQVLGAGGASVRIETFNGNISLDPLHGNPKGEQP